MLEGCGGHVHGRSNQHSEGNPRPFRALRGRGQGHLSRWHYIGARSSAFLGTRRPSLVRTLGCHYHRASVQSLLLAILGLALLAAPGRAQFGHPLKGSWIGEWGPANGDRTRVLLVLDWNGRVMGKRTFARPTTIVPIP